jgi:hypothetical protein
VVFLYADVYFSDAAMNAILNHDVADYAYYQRTLRCPSARMAWR